MKRYFFNIFVKVFLLPISLFVALVSCNKYDNASITFPSDIFLSQCSVASDVAITVANSFREENGMVLTTKSCEVVDDIFTIGKNNFAYVINYSAGGFVIIASDERMNPILGYSDTGYLGAELCSKSCGFQSWLSQMEDELDFLKRSVSSQDKIASSLWNRYKDRVNTKSLQPHPGFDLIDTLVGPLLTDSWLQIAPYNRSIAPYKIGCLPLALARVMHYNHHPTRFDWSSMSNLGGSDALDELIVDLHSNLLSENLISYLMTSDTFEYVTGSDVDGDYESFLSDYYGYPNVHQVSYNPSSDYLLVSNELIYNHRPVIFMADGRNYIEDSPTEHSWVCDGAQQYDTPVIDEQTGEILMAYSNRFFHHAWGEPNMPDIWLNCTSFNTGTVNYSSDFHLIYNIQQNWY